MEAPIFEHLKYEIRRKGHEIGGNGCRKMRYLEVDNQIWFFFLPSSSHQLHVSIVELLELIKEESEKLENVS
jgi:hypothetical protein